MKQKVLKLMCLLCVGMMSMSAWADEVVILSEDFSSITSGNSTSTSGSGTSWDGNTNFPSAGNDKAYQAGGAVKLGGSSATGSIKTKSLDLSGNDGKYVVQFDVKGWSKVEGSIKVTSSNGDTETVSYTETMSGSFETKSVSFEDGSANTTITIATTSKRAFIDNVKIYYIPSGGSTPSITVSETTFELGVVNINEAVNRTFTVSQENLTAAIAVSSTIGTVTPTSIAKDADDTEVTFSYTPTVAGAFSGTITIADATDDITNTISVTGTAIDPSLNKNFKVFSGDLIEGDYIIYYDGKAMKNTVSSNRLQYEEVTPVGDVITTQDASIIWHIAKSGDYWTIYSEDIDKYAAGNGTKNQGAVIDDGTDDKALWTVTGSSTYEFVNKNNDAASVNANLRNNGTYGFACYSAGTGDALTLYRCNDYKLTVSASGYATYYDSNIAYTMPAGLTGFVATNPSAGKITLKPAYSAGDVVPAGVALVLKGSADDYTLAWTTGGTAPTENLLKGTDAAATTTGGDKYYKLSYDSTGENLGFYWAEDDGAEFTNGAHKAYLALTDAQASSVKGFRLDFDEATGITELTESTEKTEGTEGVIYNLNGQRVNSLQKGINIVNGKKVLVK